MWSLTAQYNVDPWLMMGLMRQESAYRETVRSWVGAIGYIQVMPATGAKVAYLLNEASYSPQNLENPQTNLKYGIFTFQNSWNVLTMPIHWRWVPITVVHTICLDGIEIESVLGRWTTC